MVSYCCFFVSLGHFRVSTLQILSSERIPVSRLSRTSAVLYQTRGRLGLGLVRVSLGLVSVSVELDRVRARVSRVIYGKVREIPNFRIVKQKQIFFA